MQFQLARFANACQLNTN